MSLTAILMRYPIYRTAVMLWKVFSPILIIVGNLGNLLTIVVLMRRGSRGTSTSVYLTALAFIDMLVLNTGLVRQWIRYTFDLDIRFLSENGCKVHTFFVYVSLQCSSWILVAVTLERVIGVWFPHKVKRGCTRVSSIIVVCAIITGFMLLNIHWFIGYTSVTYTFGNLTEVVHCHVMNDEYEYFLQYTWPWIDLSFVCVVPFGVLLIGNGCILARVILSKHKTRTQIVPQGQSNAHAQGLSISQGQSVTQIQSTSNNAVRSSSDKTSQLTATLITLNVVFFICVSPVSIYLIGQPHWLSQIQTYEEYAVMLFWWALSNLFMYLNNTINFLLYFLSGSRFRQEVKNLFYGLKSRSIFPGATTASRMPSRAPFGASTRSPPGHQSTAVTNI